MIAFSLGNPISSAAWVKAPPLTQATYLAALSHRIQQLIDRIPEEEEPELREMIKSYLEPFNLEPQMESLPFLGAGTVSYTHLDVYKRQRNRCWSTRPKSKSQL